MFFCQNKKLILGGGSNILLTKDFEGLVLKIENKGISFKNTSENEVEVTAAAGEDWHNLVLASLKQGLSGLENLSLIPGTVGGAPMQNIGAYGTEIKDCFVSLDALSIQSGKLKTFNKEECRFSYRESIFKDMYKDQYIVWSVKLKLNRKINLNYSYGAIAEVLKRHHVLVPTAKDISKAVIEIRKSKLPAPEKTGNGGSFFKNPIIEASHFENIKNKYEEIPFYPVDKTLVKIPAGWLIEQCGWKGKRMGNIGVHNEQSLVLVNYGGGKGKDIVKLAEAIQFSVKNKFDIQLQLEISII